MPSYDHFQQSQEQAQGPRPSPESTLRHASIGIYIAGCHIGPRIGRFRAEFAMNQGRTGVGVTVPAGTMAKPGHLKGTLKAPCIGPYMLVRSRVKVG